MPDQVATSTESPTFSPTVFITREKPGVYDVVVDTLAPNSCYRVGTYQQELPPGIEISIPEYEHLVCEAIYTGGMNRMCLMYIKPMRWDAQDLKIGEGKTHLVVHILIGNAVVGSKIVKLPSGVPA